MKPDSQGVTRDGGPTDTRPVRCARTRRDRWSQDRGDAAWHRIRRRAETPANRWPAGGGRRRAPDDGRADHVLSRPDRFDRGGTLTTRPRPLVAVYADESCLGNGRDGDNPGGAGVLVEYAKPDGELVRRDVWVSEPATTNNRMALRSVIEAFRALSRKGQQFRVAFTSDSRYLIDGMT